MEDQLIQVTQEQWNKISTDYKGQWESWHKHGGWQPDLPDTWIGKKTVLEGCIVPGAGTALLTEGVHFEIVEDEEPVDHRSFIEKEIDRLCDKRNSEGLTIDEEESLYEYEGRLQAIEAERDFLNGERGYN